MSKHHRAEATPTTDNFSTETPRRSNERALLASAIAASADVVREDAALARARERSQSDVRAARRVVEDAETAVLEARTLRKAALADAYLAEDEAPLSDHDPVIDASAALERAKEKLADFQEIAATIAAHVARPGRGMAKLDVDAAIRAVVKSAPITRRLVEDYQTARRAFQQYESTLIFLALARAIPDDLHSVAPSASATRYAEPDPAWVRAFELLRTDPDFELPA